LVNEHGTDDDEFDNGNCGICINNDASEKMQGLYFILSWVIFLVLLVHTPSRCNNKLNRERDSVRERVEKRERCYNKLQQPLQ
jgi:hypothetical protein